MEGGSSMSFMLQINNKLPSSTEVLETLWNPNPSPSNFHGDSYSCSTSMGTSEDLNVEGQTNMHIFQHVEKEENTINDCDGYFYQPEKKRRLRSDQVHRLERSFEVENKLEPERKVHLAKELGLQPRQVAIWFQNRRARFKTKQLEKDYDGLKASYDRLKGDYDSLVKEKERLENEVHILTKNMISNEKERTISESTQRNKTSVAVFQTPISDIKSRDLLMMGKHEDASTANSDVLDSEQSDGENELFAKSLFPTQLLFPKLEDTCFNDSADDGYDATWNFSTDCQASWLWPS